MPVHLISKHDNCAAFVESTWIEVFEFAEETQMHSEPSSVILSDIKVEVVYLIINII